MNDGDALYKNICEHPEDDTLRLIYADYLDEQGDEESRIRAEYIRLSVSMQFPPDEANFSAVADWDEKYTRCKRIAIEHGKKWIDPKCRICNGDGYKEQLPGEPRCIGCFGLGDIYHTRGRFNNVKSRSVEYERGFPVSVTCKIEEVFSDWNTNPFDPQKQLWIISEWCKQIVETTPITRFMIKNLITYRIPSGRRPNIKTVYQWREYTGNATGITGVLPVWLFRLIWNNIDIGERTYTDSYRPIPGTLHLQYNSSQEAYTALGIAIGREVRRQVYGNKVSA